MGVLDMNEDFVSFSLAMKLKEKGFKEECIATYDIEDGEFDFNNYVIRVAYKMNVTAKDCLRLFNNTNTGLIDAPTISQVLKWLREEKVISVEPYASASGWRVTICRAYHKDRTDAGGGTCLKREVIGYNDGGAFEKHEDAANAGIEYVIDNLI